MSADFFTRLVSTQAQGPNIQSPKAKEGAITLYLCPECEARHEDESEAKSCCPLVIQELILCAVCRTEHDEESEAAACCAGSKGQPMQCPLCMQKAESFEEASDCCLHVHPTITAYGRQLIAKAVASGTPWPDAIKLHVNH